MTARRWATRLSQLGSHSYLRLLLFGLSYVLIAQSCSDKPRDNSDSGNVSDTNNNSGPGAGGTSATSTDAGKGSVNPNFQVPGTPALTVSTEDAATSTQSNTSPPESTDASTGGTPNAGSAMAQGKSIEREKLSGPFAPETLEDSIDALVAELNAAMIVDNIAIGVVLEELINASRPMSVGANRALSELEIVGSVQGSVQENLSQPEKVAIQVSFVKEQQSLEYAGLGIAPHNEELIPSINAFSEMGPVITIDNDQPDSKRVLYIGTDPTQAGTTCGETLTKLLGGTTGRVLLLGSSDASLANDYARTNAAAQVLEAAGNRVEVLDSTGNPDEDVTQIEKAIQDGRSGETLVGMLGVLPNAYSLAAASVETNQQLTPIVAFGSESQTLEYLNSGLIAATHFERSYYMGYLSVYLLYSINILGLDRTKEIFAEFLVGDFQLDPGLDVVRSADLESYAAFLDFLGI